MVTRCNDNQHNEFGNLKGRALLKAPGKHPMAINWGIQVVGGRLRFDPNGRQMLQVFLQAGCESRTLVP